MRKLILLSLLVLAVCSSGVFALNLTQVRGYYAFDSSIVTDSAGVNVVGTNNGATTGVTGKLQTAYYFNRSQSDYVNLNNLSVIPWNTTTFAVCAWVEQASNGSTVRTIFGSQENGGAGRLLFEISAANVLSFTKISRAPSVTYSLPTTGLNHLCGVADSSNLSLYVNGTRVASVAQANTIAQGGAARVFIGARPVGNVSIDQYFDGLIDEVYLTSEAFTATQVNELYNGGAGYNPYFSNVSPTSNMDITATDSWTGQSLKEYSVRFDNRSPYYVSNFSGSISSLNDVSGNGYNLTNSGATLTDLGYSGQAYRFDGSDDWQYIDRINQTLSINTNYTIGFWARTTADTTQMFIGHSLNGSDRIALGVIGTTAIFNRYNGTSYTKSGTITPNTWFYFTAVSQVESNILNSSQTKFYINGVEQTGSTNMLPSSAVFGRTYIGQRGNSQYWLNGSLDSLTFFNRSLSSSEVLALYNGQHVNTSGLVAYYPFDTITNSTLEPFSNLSDKSGNGNTLTNNGATWVGDSVTGEGYYSFNGVANPLNRTLGLNVSTQGYTFVYRMLPQSTATNVQLWNGVAGASNAQTQFFTYSNGGTLYFRAGNGTTFSTANFAITNNTPVHVAGTFNGTTLSFYKDGTLANTATAVLPLYSSAQTFAIGSEGGFGNKFVGEIYETLVYNRSLNATEISALYNNQTILSGLVAYYDFDNQPSQYNLTFNATNYFGDTVANHPITSDATDALHQVRAAFYANEYVTGNQLTGASFFISDGTYTTTVGESVVANLKAGSYNVTASKSGYYSKTQQFTFTPLQTVVEYVDDMYNAQVNITAKNIQTNAAITNFTVNFSSNNYAHTGSIATTNGTVIFPALNGTYTVDIDASGYALVSDQSITVAGGATQTNVSFSIYTTNSVLFMFYNEATGALINTTPVYLDLIGELLSYNYTTSNGTIYADLLSPQTYAARYAATNYTTRYSYVSITDRTTQNQTVYLLPTSSGATNITVTVLDSAGFALADALVKVLKYSSVENQYELILQQLSNFEGQIVFDGLIGSEFYKFIVEYPVGDVALETDPTYLYSEDITLVVPTEPSATQGWFNYLGVETSLEFNPATNNFRFTYSDTNSVLEQACMYVYTVNASLISTLYNQSCSSSASGTLLLPVDNATTMTYTAKTYLTIDGTEYFNRKLSVSFEEPSAFNTLGLLIAALLTVGIVFLFVQTKEPAIVVLIVPLAITFTNVVGITSFSVWVPAAIWTICGFVAYIVSRR